MEEERGGEIFSTDELYKFALVYFKENEGRNFHVQFDEKLVLVALTQQANHGNIKNVDLPPLGALDVIGKQRRSAWSVLGDMDKQEAKKQFVSKLKSLVPHFQTFINQKSEEESKRREEEAIQQKKAAEQEALDKQVQQQKQKEEQERRKIKDALNKQTFQQFKVYAEQQYPDNPDQQAVLMKQLQEQHYHQYMQQLVAQQQVAGSTAASPSSQNNTLTGLQTQEHHHHHCDAEGGEGGQLHHLPHVSQNGGGPAAAGSQHQHHHHPLNTATSATAVGEAKEMVCLGGGEHGVAGAGGANHLHLVPGQEGEDLHHEIETNLSLLDINKSNIEELEAEEANMWTRKDLNDFKESIKNDEWDAIIKVGHGETVTIRVPTHQDGKALYWEFATDHYDIGFGVFFEWVEPEDTQVTVHVSDSEDEDEDEIFDEDGEGGGAGEAGARGLGPGGDPETGGGKGYPVDNGPPTSCIVPIYRRDCHEEVYAGCHNYPSQGVYLLKFDNSYSLWRSKTLYYRVYYTR
eukprot:TRINITY_DN6540_c0_g1_i1.p1 TRINITY_DN6540_c0_g1~~TRINITY_DN6540_c0_g1_i1.p1  ORF type:complete len:518 (-),score=176.92 TRINITY_DN6540_c0_g1_i1:283-1836(-)